MLCVVIRQIYSSTEDLRLHTRCYVESKAKNQVMYMQHLKYDLDKSKGECLVNMTNLQYSKRETQTLYISGSS